MDDSRYVARKGDVETETVLPGFCVIIRLTRDEAREMKNAVPGTKCDDDREGPDDISWDDLPDLLIP